MAEISSSIEERERIAAVLCELGSVVDDFFSDAREALDCDTWLVLVEFATARMRRVLELGASLNAVADAHEGGAHAFPGRGRAMFVRDALLAWGDAYGSIPDPWRVAAVFERVPGGEKRVLADVATLETMAANRFFATLDQQYEQLLGDDGRT